MTTSKANGRRQRSRGEGTVYKRGGKFYANYVDCQGRRRRHVLKYATTEQEAIRDLEQIKDTERLKARGLLPSVDNSAEIPSLVGSFLLAKLKDTRYGTARHYAGALAGTVGQFWSGDGHVWPPTRQKPIEQVLTMERHFRPGPLAAQCVEDITSQRLREYIREHRDLKDRTLDARVVALKAALDWAVEEGIIASNPLANMRALSGGKRKTRQKWGGEAAESARALEAEEVDALLDVSPEPYRTMWLCLLTTGMRRGELVNLRWPQVDLFKSRITILASTSKTREDRVVPIAPELQEALVALRAEALDPEGHVFVNEAGRRWRNNLLKRFKRCAEHALVGTVTRKDGRWHIVYRDHGEEEWEPLPEGVRGWRAAKKALMERRGDRLDNVRIHSTRHTFATHLIRQGVDIAVVSKLLGHGSVKTTWDIYHHLLEGDPEKAVARLPFGNGHKELPNVTTTSQAAADPSQLTA